MEAKSQHKQRALEMRPETSIREIVEEIPNNPATDEPYAAATISKWIHESDSEAGD